MLEDTQPIQIEPDEHDPPVRDPKTGTIMERFRVGPINIDRNPDTGAVWLDGGELGVLLEMGDDPKKLIKSLDPARRPSNLTISDRDLHCPRDGATLITVRDSKRKSVEFEACPVCGGVYFDAGELRQISAASMREKLRAILR